MNNESSNHSQGVSSDLHRQNTQDTPLSKNPFKAPTKLESLTKTALSLKKNRSQAGVSARVKNKEEKWFK